jgi:hypothetical protein
MSADRRGAGAEATKLAIMLGLVVAFLLACYWMLTAFAGASISF